jgi:Pyridoxamine 5'-phosphate oxidase
MNTLTDPQKAFLETEHGAAMITTSEGGTAHAVRVGIALIDGKIWSSGIPGHKRSSRLRLDPHCTFFVFDKGYKFLTLEGNVRILEGDSVPDLSVRLFRAMQHRSDGDIAWFGKEMSVDDFKQAMAAEKRLIYEMDIQRAYGMV